ncbi:MAG: ribosome maturation factor RimP [Bacillota bacterium]
MAGNVKSMVEDICRNTVENSGYELVDLEFRKEHQGWVLRVFIDHPEGIGLDDCEKVSKALSSELDKDDPIPHKYVLEVSSPGLDRPLKNDKDFERFSGHQIKIKTYTPFEGKKTIKGSLVGLEDDNIIVLLDNEEKKIPRSQVSTVRLIPEY